ncbi:MAG: L-lactate dehydrogenase [Fulvivirga sp.]
MGKRTSIGIIGMGWVGSSVAISILQRGLCNHLLINDINGDIAEGEAMDLNHGSSFFPSAQTSACDIVDMMACQAIVVTAGRGGKPGETRLDLLQENIKIAKQVSKQLKGYKGLLIIVSNPVDVLTYYYQKFTGLPVNQVIGTGTMLDTARLREVIGRKVNIDPKSVHAHVIGEHGDSEVILWSKAMISGVALKDWPGWNTDFEDEIAVEVRTAAQEIIKRKGATNHAIGLVTATLLKWLLRGERRVVNIASVQSTAYGLDDVALSLPTVISENGVEEVVNFELTESEKTALNKSAQVLREAIARVKS